MKDSNEQISEEKEDYNKKQQNLQILNLQNDVQGVETLNFLRNINNDRNFNNVEIWNNNIQNNKIENKSNSYSEQVLNHMKKIAKITPQQKIQQYEYFFKLLSMKNNSSSQQNNLKQKDNILLLPFENNFTDKNSCHNDLKEQMTIKDSKLKYSAMSFLQLIQDHCDALQEASISLVYEKNFYIKQVYSSKCSYIMVFEVQISFFKIQIEVYNLPTYQTYFDQFIDTYGQLIGSGGGGRIHTLPNNMGVVKRIPLINNQYSDSNFMKNILKQIAVSKLLSCFQIGPKIIKPYYFDMICTNSNVCFFMQECASMSSISSFYNLPPSFIYQIIEKDLKADLFLLHQLQIIHFDIKPQNVMYSHTFQKVIFIDFGLTQYRIFPHSIMQQQTFKGTYFYSSDNMRQLISLGVKSHVDVYHNDIHCLAKTPKIIETEIKAFRYEQNKQQNNESQQYFFHKQSILSAKQSQQEPIQADNKKQIVLNPKQSKSYKNSCQKIDLLILTYFIFKNHQEKILEFVKNHNICVQLEIENIICIFHQLEWNFIRKEIFNKYFAKIYDFLTVKEKIIDYLLIDGQNQRQSNPKQKLKINLPQSIKKQNKLQGQQPLQQKKQIRKGKILLKSAQNNLYIYTQDNQEKQSFQKTSYYKKNKNSLKTIQLRYQFSSNEFIPNLSVSAYKRTLLKLERRGKQKNKEFFQNREIQKYFILYDYIEYFLNLIVNNFDETNDERLIKQSQQQVCLYLTKISELSPIFTQKYKGFDFHSTNKVDFLKLVSYSIQSAYEELQNDQIFLKNIQHPQAQQIFIRIYVPLKHICIHYTMVKAYKQLNSLQIKRLKAFMISKIRIIQRCLSQHQKQKIQNKEQKISQTQEKQMNEIILSMNCYFYYIFNSSLTQMIQQYEVINIKKMVTTILSFHNFINQLKNIYNSLINLSNQMRILQLFNSYLNSDKRLLNILDNPLFIFIDNEQTIQKIQFVYEMSKLFVLNLSQFPHQCPIIVQKVKSLEKKIVSLNSKSKSLFFGENKSQDIISSALSYIKYKCLHKMGKYQQAITLLRQDIAPFNDGINCPGKQTEFIIVRLKFYKQLCLVYREVFELKKSMQIQELLNTHVFNAQAKPNAQNESNQRPQMMKQFENDKKKDEKQDKVEFQNIKSIKSNNRYDYSYQPSLKDNILCYSLKLQKQTISTNQKSEDIYKINNIDTIYEGFQQARTLIFCKSFHQQNFNTLIDILQIIQQIFIKRSDQLQEQRKIYEQSPIKFKYSEFNDKPSYLESSELQRKHIISYFYDLMSLQDVLKQQIKSKVAKERLFNVGEQQIAKKGKLLRLKCLKMKLLEKYLKINRLQSKFLGKQREGLKNRFRYYIYLYKYADQKQTNQYEQFSKDSDQTINRIRYDLTKDFVNFLFQELVLLSTFDRKQKVSKLIDEILKDLNLSEIQFVTTRLIQPLHDCLSNQDLSNFQIKKTKYFNIQNCQKPFNNSHIQKQHGFSLYYDQLCYFFEQITQKTQKLLIQSNRTQLFLVNQDVLKLGQIVIIQYLKKQKFQQLIRFINQVSQKLRWLSNQCVFQRFFMIFVKNTIVRIKIKSLQSNDKSEFKSILFNPSDVFTPFKQNRSKNFLHTTTQPSLHSMFDLLLILSTIKGMILKDKHNLSNSQITVNTVMLLMNFIFQLTNQLSKCLLQNKSNLQIKKKISFYFNKIRYKQQKHTQNDIQKNTNSQEIDEKPLNQDEQINLLILQLLNLWKKIIRRYFGQISWQKLRVIRKIQYLRYQHYLSILYQIQNNLNIDLNGLKRLNKIKRLTNRQCNSFENVQTTNLSQPYFHLNEKVQKKYFNKIS